MLSKAPGVSMEWLCGEGKPINVRNHASSGMLPAALPTDLLKCLTLTYHAGGFKKPHNKQASALPTEKANACLYFKIVCING